MKIQEFEVDPMHATLLRDLRHSLPSRPSLRTIQRWATDGCKNRSTGEYVRLPTIKTQLGEASTVSAYRFFIERLNDA